MKTSGGRATVLTFWGHVKCFPAKWFWYDFSSIHLEFLVKQKFPLLVAGTMSSYILIFSIKKSTFW
jgi:hypothetical protein